MISFCRSRRVALVVVGPEQPLAEGLVDKLAAVDIPVFGPTQAAARIESSKAWSKDFMDRHDIPTAEFKTFKKDQKDLAKEYITSVEHGVVVKASGLCAGKGVLMPTDQKEALAAIDEVCSSFLPDESDEFVVEELLEGVECSVFALTDGHTVVCLPPAQDHKRAYDGDKGPNTGG